MYTSTGEKKGINFSVAGYNLTNGEGYNEPYNGPSLGVAHGT